jgi:glycosyltransferase involved in cell wall biosynthesis
MQDVRGQSSLKGRAQRAGLVPPTRISVAMATFNGERYILQQLESIAGQTLLPTELVITDDGSTDETLKIVEEFAGSARFSLKIVRNPSRLGYADNFLKAASLCQGDLIAFCDQDDIWMDEKLSVCAQFFCNPEVVLAAHSAETILPSGERGSCYPHFSRTIVWDHGKCNPFANRPGFAMVIRKDLLHLFEPDRRPERLLSHDHWLWFLAASSGKVATVGRILTLYRQHEGNVFGAPARPAIASGVKSSAATLEYDNLADFELKCAKILDAAVGQAPRLGDRLRNSARKMERRSQLHRLRTRIYARDSSFLRRGITFVGIFRRGGYLPDSSGTRLGLRAGLKDLFFGVSGAWRLGREHA